MIDKEKLARLVELKAQHDCIEAEINELLGGEPVKQKRHRRTREEIEADQRASAMPQPQL